MYFGEYLISKNKISSSQLIDALITQLEELPSILRTLKNSKLLSDERIVELIGEQAKQNSDLLSIIREKQALTVDQLNTLFAGQTEKRRPIGEILVAAGAVDSGDVDSLVDDYLAIEDSGKVESAKNSNEPTMSAAALESLRELGIDSESTISVDIKTDVSEDKNDSDGFDFTKPLPDIFVGEYFSAFSEAEKNKLMKILEMMKTAAANGDDVANVVNSLFREFHIVMGAANLAELQVTNGLINIMDKIAAGLFSIEKDSLVKWVGENIHILGESVDVIWLIRESLQINGSEKNFWEKDSLKKQYLDIKNNLDILISKQ